MTDPSFYFAIFKKLQACDNDEMAFGYGHFAVTDQQEGYSGGFCLAHPQHPNGVFGKLTAAFPETSCPAGLDGAPLLADAAGDSPLFVVLQACMQGQMGDSVSSPPGFEKWPVMPFFGDISQNPSWTEFNSGTNDLVGALGTWIEHGKADDTPKPTALAFDMLDANRPKAIGTLKPASPVLFVASMPGDDGRRPGDNGPGTIAADHVPPNYWATSQIFTLNADDGSQHFGDLAAGKQYYVAALIGNCGNAAAGRLISGQPQIHVTCEAQAFNTMFSPGVALPALSNLDPLSVQANYEQYCLRPETWDIAGFRLDVDLVVQELANALVFNHVDIGGADSKAWVMNGHPCVKVLIAAGETMNGLHPAWNDTPDYKTANPRTDRHIAQRNLAQFTVPAPGPKKPKWKNFIVAQAGRGDVNRLVLQHALRAEGQHFYLAMPKATFEHYVRKGGALHNFEEVHDAGTTPFPDAVILRETARGGEIAIAAHDKQMFLGMALGLAFEATTAAPLGDVSIVHQRRDGMIVGGFTLQVATVKA